MSTPPFRLAGVLGYPVSHSLSPLMHNAWLKELGIAGEYVLLEIPPDGLKAKLVELKARGFAGANVTIPHKIAVMALIDSIDPVARAIGAVNTLVIANGRIEGRNTDAAGFLAHLDASAPGWKTALGGRSVLILGAGGAARAVMYALAGAGLSKIVFANRNMERAQALAGATAHVVRWEDRARAVGEAGLIINTTSLGMRGQPSLDLDLSAAPVGAIVYDLVYNPLPTELLRRAKHRGLVAVDGLGMLIQQARAGFKAWFGVDPPVTPEVYRRLAAALPSN